MGELSGAHSGRVYFLVSRPSSVGGIVRAVSNLANQLVERYDVEFIGLRPYGRELAYPLDPAVTVRHIVDGSRRWRWLDRLPSTVHRQARSAGLSALTDLQLRRLLRALPPGIVISTRPMLHLAVARLARGRHVLVGQDHLNFPRRQHVGHVPVLGQALAELDRFVVLTEADARDYREAFPSEAGKVRVIRNSTPWVATQARTAAPDHKVVVAAGRLVGQKGFDRLITAYAPIARTRPDWQLHIYGEGPNRPRLERMIARRGLGGHVVLKGHVPDFDRALESASLYAMTSRFEGFPMVLIEAMSKAVPAISFDCPRGPGEIITDGHDGRLVADGDIRGFTRALLSLMDDPERRSRMAAEALRTAAQYRTEAVMQQWEDLFAELRDVQECRSTRSRTPG
jgi:glycosyltransferase involved in cell wall biosynthesis